MLKNTRNTQVLFAQEYDGLWLEDDGLPLEDGELIGFLCLKLVDELDEVALTVLAKVLGAQIRQLIHGLDAVNADFVLLHQLLYEKVPQCDVLCARTVSVVAGDVQRRRVVNVQLHAAEALVEA